MNDFARYCLASFRDIRRWHWSYLLKHRITQEPHWLHEARKARKECHRYAQLARKHGYGHSITTR